MAQASKKITERMDRATWNRKIISHTVNPLSSRPTLREQQGRHVKKNSQLQGRCLTSGLGCHDDIYNIVI